MAYLSEHLPALSAEKAAHLLRRVTCGPTKSEILQFTNLTASQAYQTLLNNIVLNPSEPIILDEGSAYYKQTFVTGPFRGEDNFVWSSYIKYWWEAQIVQQDTPPSLLEKLAIFWQNHFVTTREIVSDYRFIWRYLNTIRTNSLGNFKVFVKEITKDPAMLLYLNGNENVKGSPNENYARELQELFTVGEKDFNGNLNYTEDDVKAAARVLTGWQFTNYWYEGSTSFGSEFVLNNHDITDKLFSENYNNTLINGENTANGGDLELNMLVDMLMDHPEAAKFICRKLYKWYINPAVSQDIETNVIIPLADFFKSPANNFAIEPVLKKLLISDVFYDENNIGAIIKSPVELAAGSLRHFGMQVPDMQNDSISFRKYFEYLDWQLYSMQMSLLDQPSVFGWEPYYQSALSRAWIASSTIALRYNYTDQYIWGWYDISPTYDLGINLVEWAISLQPNFLIVTNTSTDNITVLDVLESFTHKLFVSPLFQAQKDFLVDTIMMQGLPRNSWLFEWRAFRIASKNIADGIDDATYTDKFNGIRWRLQMLMRYLLRMAEYQVY
ncbi:MAG: DUF1800 domain-containing protein [Bacteroidota bacterium]